MSEEKNHKTSAELDVQTQETTHEQEVNLNRSCSSGGCNVVNFTTALLNCGIE